jgi:hypothetical protein
VGNLARKRSELTIRLIKRSQIPTARPLNLDKGHWESVVHSLGEAAKDEAMELFLSGGRSPHSIKSSLHRAAIRAGKRVAILIRGSKAYAWVTGDSDSKPSRPSRGPLTCLVCGNPITLPKYGGTRQVVHAGEGNKKSECQKTWRYKQEQGVSIEEAKEHRRRLPHGRGLSQI